MEKMYGTVADAVEFSGLGRTTLYEAMKTGALPAKKAGRRTLISFIELRAYIDALPSWEQAEGNDV